MATLKDLVYDLKKADPECRIAIYTPSGLSVPCHFHITEIGRTAKKFVDCGGVERETSDTTFQIWVAEDTDHKMTVGKFLNIIEAGSYLVDEEDQIVFEYDNNHTIGLYGISLIQQLEHFFNMFLVQKRANCLAPDKCGVKPEQMPKTCCGNKGCC
jgi:hypothetical protein